MNQETYLLMKRLEADVEQLKANTRTAEDLRPLLQRIEKLEGEVKAMKARMGKNAKAE